MERVLVVIPCGKLKIWDKNASAPSTRARDAYIGVPFKKNREYAECFGDDWLILSAKYGLIEPGVLIDNYDVTFNRRSTNPVAVAFVRDQIGRMDLGGFTAVIGLGGVEYRNVLDEACGTSPLRPRFPFAGLSQGRVMRAISEAIKLGRWNGSIDPRAEHRGCSAQ